MTEKDTITQNVAKLELTEKQKRKLIKDQRRKKFADIVIQGTNDYSIVSKRSVEKLYSSVLNKRPGDDKPVPEYFKHFVRKFQRRSPAINRGYWTRMEAIKQSTHKIIQHALSQDKKVVIINLGAGYDPLAFQYLDPLNFENKDHLGKLTFIDVDYPDLNKIKTQMIENSQELQDIIGEKIPSTIEGVEIRTKNYTVLSCDLKNIDLFLKQLRSLDLDNDNVTKIYIAEVSIAYMLPEHADPVIAATSALPDSHFLCLEQLLPAGPYQGFGRTMLFHFSKLNSPLQSVSTYPTIPKQVQRFQKAGYPVAEATDLMGFWRSLPEELRHKVEQIEAFDEMEEFIHFAQHYIILHATNSDFSLFTEEIDADFKVEETTISQEFHLQEVNSDLERKFAASVTAEDDTILVNGGASISRLNSTLFSKHDGMAPKVDDSKISARLAHTLNQLHDGSFLLVGGRHSPNKALSDCWLLNPGQQNYEWIETESVPSPRSRHSAFNVDQDVYVYGGTFTEEPFIKYTNGNWEKISTVGDLKSKKSSAVAFNGSKGVVIGGMDASCKISDTLHIFEINGNEVTTELLFKHPLLSRYSSKAVFISDDELLLFGGVSDLFLHNQSTSVVKVDLTHKKISTVRIPDEIWKEFPMLVGFDLLKYKDSLVCIGGGEVCYSFGSIWNKLLVLGPDNVPEFKLQTPLG